MNTTPHFRSYLYTSLAREYNEGQVENMISQFDKLANAGGPEMAFCVAMESYGNEDTSRACKTVKDWIQRELSEFAAKHTGIDTNGQTRLKRAIKTLAENIDKVSIIFDGQELSRAEIERLKPKIPACLRQPTLYSASANDKTGKTSNLVLEVTFTR